MTGPELDLTQCDREPIHIPGAVQPHGLLLVFDAGKGALVAWAGDCGLLPGGASPTREALEGLLGHPVADLAVPAAPTYLGTYDGCDVVAHRSANLLLLELEPAGTARPSAADALGAAQALSSGLEAAHDSVEASRRAAAAIRTLTGYDRVMVYRFLADGSGAVVAEEKAEDEPSLLNHHFPASDIPRQARALYLRNLVRVIPDVEYAPAPLTAVEAAPEEPVDMSDCALRSVSPVHIQYLKNMGVAASASVSIVASGELWGLIACHHRSPRRLGYVERELAKHMGQLLGQQLASRQRADVQLETVRLAQAREEVISGLGGFGGIEEALSRRPGELMRIVPSDGVAVCRGGDVALAGSAPPEDEVRALLPLVARRGGTLVTASLSREHPPAAEYAAPASGVLACSAGRNPPLVLFWFRAERLETVNWAGNPHKPAEGEAGMLSPRRSFDLWQETMRGQSRRWSRAEIDAAERFRDEIAEGLRREELDALNRQLRRTLGEKEELLGQKDLLMREVNHRVQNSLQLVNSMLYLQERDAGNEEVRAQFELARQRLTAVAMVHRRLWRTDKIGDVRLETFLAELAEELVKIWGPAWEPHIRIDAPPVALSTDRGIVLGLILTELLTNAVKYAYRGEPGPLVVDAREEGEGELRVAVADRGVGVPADVGTGSFGSRLIQALTRQLGGRLEISDNAPGTRAALVFPIRG